MLAGGNQIVDAFAFVFDIHGTEEQEFLILGQIVFLAYSAFIHRFEYFRVDGVRNIRETLPLCQTALSCHGFHPLAASHKSNLAVGK